MGYKGGQVRIFQREPGNIVGKVNMNGNDFRSITAGCEAVGVDLDLDGITIKRKFRNKNANVTSFIPK